MFERIVVAIDFSDPSVEALRWAGRRFPEARLTLVHSMERIRPPGYLMRALGDELDLRIEKELDVQTNLEHLAEECGITAQTVIRTGWAPREVNGAAADADADLIVLAAPRPRPRSMPEAGATAARIVEQAERPIYLWRPAPRRADLEDRAVLAALDLREGSEPVGALAAGLATHLGARLILCHILTRTLQAYLRAVSSPQVVQDTLRQFQEHARRDVIEHVPPELREALDPQVIIGRGRPVTQILAAAESESVDVIVMGAHAPTLPGRAFLGGVTHKVMRASNSAVLALPL